MTRNGNITSSPLRRGAAKRRGGLSPVALAKDDLSPEASAKDDLSPEALAKDDLSPEALAKGWFIKSYE